MSYLPVPSAAGWFAVRTPQKFDLKLEAGRVIEVKAGEALLLRPSANDVQPGQVVLVITNAGRCELREHRVVDGVPYLWQVAGKLNEPYEEQRIMGVATCVVRAI